MSHPIRIELRGAWYHVMNRGPRQRDVFAASADREDFLHTLARTVPRFTVEVHAYCVLTTHFHLLLRTTGSNLSRVVQYLDGVYTQRYHRRHGTDGPLFRERYRAVLVQPGRHLLQVSRYIHLNPVAAGLAASPEDWSFSSYTGYLDPGRAPRWLTTATILASLGSIGARRRYRGFVEDGLDRGTRDFYGRARLPPVMGDEGFLDELRRRAARQLPDNSITGVAAVRPAPLPRIARVVCSVLEVSHEALRPGSTRRAHVLARGAFVQAARHLGGRRLSEIAAWLGYRTCDGAGKVAIRFADACARDPQLARQLAEIIARATTREVAP